MKAEAAKRVPEKNKMAVKYEKRERKETPPRKDKKRDHRNEPDEQPMRHPMGPPRSPPAKKMRREEHLSPAQERMLRLGAFVSEDLLNQCARRLFNMSDSEDKATFITNIDIGDALQLFDTECRKAHLDRRAKKVMEGTDWDRGIAFIVCHAEHFVAVVIRRAKQQQPRRITTATKCSA